MLEQTDLFLLFGLMWFPSRFPPSGWSCVSPCFSSCRHSHMPPTLPLQSKHRSNVAQHELIVSVCKTYEGFSVIFFVLFYNLIVVLERKLCVWQCCQKIGYPQPLPVLCPTLNEGTLDQVDGCSLTTVSNLYPLQVTCKMPSVAFLGTNRRRSP